MADLVSIIVRRSDPSPTTALNRTNAKPCERCLDVADAHGDNIVTNVYDANFVELVDCDTETVIRSGHLCDFCIEIIIDNELFELRRETS